MRKMISPFIQLIGHMSSFPFGLFLVLVRAEVQRRVRRSNMTLNFISFFGGQYYTLGQRVAQHNSGDTGRYKAREAKGARLIC
jgi:hypothetical protein